MTACISPQSKQGPLYLYAIIPVNHPAGALLLTESDIDVGIDVVEVDQVAAVVGPEPIGGIRGRSRQILMPLLLAHQQVVERVMASTPVLPVKFGTVAPNRESVQRCLMEGKDAFLAAFERMAGKTQFEILVTWDTEAVLSEIARMPAVVQARAALVETDGPIDELARISFGRLVKGTLEQRRTALAERFAAVLKETAIDSVTNPLMDDRMVLNLGLLIDAHRADALDRLLERLDSAYDGRLNIRCVGPLPPHSFATVEIDFLEEAEIAQACSLLGLTTSSSTNDIRSAYHRLAKRQHPDLTAVSADDGPNMADLNKAYKTLSTYAQAGDSVIVSVSRQDPALEHGTMAAVG